MHQHPLSLHYSVIMCIVFLLCVNLVLLGRQCISPCHVHSRLTCQKEIASTFGIEVFMDSEFYRMELFGRQASMNGARDDFHSYCNYGHSARN